MDSSPSRMVPIFAFVSVLFSMIVTLPLTLYTTNMLSFCAIDARVNSKAGIKIIFFIICFLLMRFMCSNFRFMVLSFMLICVMMVWFVMCFVFQRMMVMAEYRLKVILPV